MTHSGPDLAALYALHRGKMYRIAVSVLRGFGREDEAEDAVQEAIVSIMNSPPQAVKNWEALLVKTVKFRAIDIVRSAWVKHLGPQIDGLEGDEGRLGDETANVESEVTELLENERLSALALQCMQNLDGRHKKVVWDIQALGRTRNEVADDLGVSPARVSQMTTKALTQIREELKKRGE